MSNEDYNYLPDDDYLSMKYPLLDIRTIALGLGCICRRNGNCKTFWPMRMHSLAV